MIFQSDGWSRQLYQYTSYDRNTSLLMFQANDGIFHRHTMKRFHGSWHSSVLLFLLATFAFITPAGKSFAFHGLQRITLLECVMIMMDDGKLT